MFASIAQGAGEAGYAAHCAEAEYGVAGVTGAAALGDSAENGVGGAASISGDAHEGTDVGAGGRPMMRTSSTVSRLPPLRFFGLRTVGVPMGFGWARG